MTTLFYRKPELVIGLNRMVVFVNPNDHQIFKSVELPETLENVDANGTNPTEKQKVAEDDDNKSTATVTEPLRLQQVCYSPNRQLLAITTSGQKRLLLYRCRPEHAWLVSTRLLARVSSAIAFSNDSEAVLVTDKTGDCYLYDCVNMEAPPRLILGHLSIVNDVLWTSDKKHIITCDRDDKIRVTNFPETHNIHGYCLGHKEFVSSLKWLQSNVIASISGDKTLRLWNYESCKELLKIELAGAAIKFDIRKIDETRYQIAILEQLDGWISGYELLKKETGEWGWNDMETHVLGDFSACNLCFAEGRLYVAGVVNEKFALKVLTISDALPPKEKWVEMVEDQFKEYTWTPEDITVWFKKRYDNVAGYLQRKKRRIEEKKKPT